LRKHKYLKQSTETLLVASNEVDLKVNTEVTKQRAYISVWSLECKKSLGNVSKFKYLGRTVIDDNEIKSRLNSGNIF